MTNLVTLCTRLHRRSSWKVVEEDCLQVFYLVFQPVSDEKCAEAINCNSYFASCFPFPRLELLSTLIYVVRLVLVDKYFCVSYGSITLPCFPANIYQSDVHGSFDVFQPKHVLSVPPRKFIPVGWCISWLLQWQRPSSLGWDGLKWNKQIWRWEKGMTRNLCHSGLALFMRQPTSLWIPWLWRLYQLVCW